MKRLVLTLTPQAYRELERLVFFAQPSAVEGLKKSIDNAVAKEVARQGGKTSSQFKLSAEEYLKEGHDFVVTIRERMEKRLEGVVKKSGICRKGSDVQVQTLKRVIWYLKRVEDNLVQSLDELKLCLLPGE